ncbi:hypothetical protein HK102_001019 [Quaeritorhiza haematococci]|nr:hypothetical protein HK102_001019 [Quaeritorhiza haematococci]
MESQQESPNHEAYIPETYVEALANWNANGSKSLPLPSHLHLLEHHLFSLYLFDVLDRFASRSETKRWAGEGWYEKLIGTARDLKATAEYILCSLLIVSQGRYSALQAVLAGEEGERQSDPLNHPEQKDELNQSKDILHAPEPADSESSGTEEPKVLVNQDGERPGQKPQLPTLQSPDFEVDIWVDIPNGYVETFENWDAQGPKSLPPPSPLHQLEHRLFKLYLYDVLETFVNLSETTRREEEGGEQRWVGAVRDLMRRAEIILCSLLRVSQKGVWNPTLQTERPGEEVRIHSDSLKHPEQKHESNERRDIFHAPEPATSEFWAERIVPVKQDGDRPRLPTLPPEIVRIVLEQLVASTMDEEDAPFFSGPKCPAKYAALRKCVLVNKTWHWTGMPFLLQQVECLSTPSASRFLGFLFDQILCQPTSIRSQAPLSMNWVMKIVLRGGDHLGIWRILARNLFLFPNLRTLALVGLRRVGDVSILFDQDLPSLQHLMLEGDEDMTLDTHPDSWDYEPSVDSEQAHAFFYRLSSVTYGQRTHIEDDEYKCPAFLDAAHPNLRQITFPFGVPSIFEHRFFEKCSGALSVVDIGYNNLSPSGFRNLARRCTGLRALRLAYTREIDMDAFEYFMQLRGWQLLALDFGCNSNGYIKSQLFQSIASHCRSLQMLCMYPRLERDTSDSVKDDILNLLQRCGQTLKHLELNFFVDFEITGKWSSLREDLFKVIADSCPDLREFRLHFRDWGSLTSGRSYPLQLETIENLLGKCRHLGALDAFGWQGVGFNAELRELLRMHRVCSRGRFGYLEPKYFDWRFYQ